MSASGATFSDCKAYRYALWRRWADESHVLFVMLNPSTADAEQDDPTIRRCIGFAKAWGYGGIKVGNLFAYRATEPKELYRATDPVGPHNDRVLQDMAARADLVVVAWGAYGRLHGRAQRVLTLLRWSDIYCLGMTNTGEPKHPLYLRADTIPNRLISVPVGSRPT